jgi:hypothetical protein
MGLRWWRLDLMSFRFDPAETLFRVREALQTGHPPLTGIMNSLGFRNPPGLVWLMLPAGLLTPDPRAIAAWHALLALSGLFPLWRTGRRWLGGPAWLVPCAAYALLPLCVLGARNIWAQNLLPAMGAWALMFLLDALDERLSPKLCVRAAGASLGAVIAAAAVHLAALLLVPVVLLCLARPLARGTLPRRRLAGALAVGALPALVLMPSALDWVSLRTGPARAKPDYAEQFEERMEAPKPLAGRIGDSLRGVFEPFSGIDADAGLHPGMAPAVLTLSMAADGALLVLALAGMVRCGLAVGARRQKGAQSGKRAERGASASADALPADKAACGRDPLATGHALPGSVLLAWAFLPALAGAVLGSRVNASYFAAGIPAMLLIAGVGAQPPAASWSAATRAMRWLPQAVALLCAVAYPAFFFSAMRGLDREEPATGSYYVPLHEQEALVSQLAARGVTRDRFTHLSGDWFQRSYDYLFLYVPDRVQGRPWGESYGVVEDLLVRGRQRARVAAFEQGAQFRVGQVAAIVLQDRASADAFVRCFWDTPADQ